MSKNHFDTLVFSKRSRFDTCPFFKTRVFAHLRVRHLLMTMTTCVAASRKSCKGGPLQRFSPQQKVYRVPHTSAYRFAYSLAHQNRTIAIASDFRVDGAKSPEIAQKEGVLGSEIAARNRKSLATFHRTLKSQCSIAFSYLGNRCDFWDLRWASQAQIAKIAAISVR